MFSESKDTLKYRLCFSMAYKYFNCEFLLQFLCTAVFEASAQQKCLKLYVASLDSEIMLRNRGLTCHSLVAICKNHQNATCYMYISCVLLAVDGQDSQMYC